MSSRLFQSIRERSGLCYSIYTFTTPHQDTGLMSIYTGLGEETERRALERILQELHQFCEDGHASARCADWILARLGRKEKTS